MKIQQLSFVAAIAATALTVGFVFTWQRDRGRLDV